MFKNESRELEIWFFILEIIYFVVKEDFLKVVIFDGFFEGKEDIN